MKRIISFILVAVMLFVCVSALSSCGMKSKIAGTYEMTSISGTVTYNGMTTTLDQGLYEYYRLTLNKDGTALVECKAKSSTTKIEQKAEWDYEDGIIKITSAPQGITVVEEMEWNDGVIIYEAVENSAGITVSMKLTLEKK